MGSLENHGEATAGLRPAAEGSRGAEESQILRHVENASGISTNAAPISKAKNNRQSSRRPAPHFRPVFAARAHTPPSPPWEPVRRSPAAIRLRAAAQWAGGAKGKNRLPVEKNTRPNGAPTAQPGLGQPPPRAPRKESRPRAPEGTSANAAASQVRLTLGPSTFNLFSTPTTTFNNHA